MTGIFACLVAIGSITLMGALRGRLAALAATGVSTASVALTVPPFLSLQVESSTDLAAVLLQGMVGLAIATRIAPKSRNNSERIVSNLAPTNPVLKPSYSLLSIAETIMRSNPDLQIRIGDLRVNGDIDVGITVPESD